MLCAHGILNINFFVKKSSTILHSILHHFHPDAAELNTDDIYLVILFNPQVVTKLLLY